MLLRRHRDTDSYAELRRRMIRSTELALLVGMRFPEHTQRIPIMEVGKGRFHPTYAARFWQDVLGTYEAELTVLKEASTALLDRGAPRGYRL